MPLYPTTPQDHAAVYPQVLARLDTLTYPCTRRDLDALIAPLGQQYAPHHAPISVQKECLSRLLQAGELRRVKRGVYTRAGAAQGRLEGPLLPERLAS